jgi:kynureninase
MYHAVEGVRILLDVGLDAVREHSLALTDHAIARADAEGLPLRSPREPDRRSAMVLIEAPEATRLCEHLKTENVYTDSRRNEVIRMAPFVWNTRADVDRAFDAIERAVESGDYRTAAMPETIGPVT